MAHDPLTKVSLKRFFQRYSAARLRMPAAKGNLYELFVFLNACAAARRAGLTTALWAPGGTYIVRVSPGALGGVFGYAIFTSASGATYELHNRVEINGQSAVLHDADLLLVNAPSATHSGPPRAALGGRELLWTAECKLYASPNRLKGEARKAVGAVVDWSQSAHQSNNNFRMQGCLHCGMGFRACFVTNVRQGLRPDIEDFLDAYEIVPFFSALPRQKGLAALKAHFIELASKLP